MSYVINNSYVYKTESNGKSKFLVGSVINIEKERINETTVADVTYKFDIEQGKYVEQSRVEREEPLPVPQPSAEDRITQLETENADLWYEAMRNESKLAEHDADIADLYYTIMTTGGAGA